LKGGAFCSFGRHFSRRHFLKLGGAVPLGLALPHSRLFAPSALGDEVHHLAVRDKVPDPKDIFFSVQYPGKPPIRLAGHFWYNAETVSAGKKCPAIVEFVPYRSVPTPDGGRDRRRARACGAS
jgi:hypothetical protein